MKFWSFLLAGFAFGAVALAQEDIWSKTINTGAFGDWTFQPEKPKTRVVKVEGQQFERAFHVKAHKGANPWDQQARAPIKGAINEGDVIMVMYYARAAEAAEGGSKLSARVQANAAPYTSVLEMTSDISDVWKSYCAHRVATSSLAENSAGVSIHLATAEQVIELGPVFVFNFGKDYKRAKLKGCDG